MSDPGDDVLLERYRAGSEDAFQELVRRHAGMVHAVCWRGLGGDGFLADDATQAVFLLLARKAGSIRDGRALAGWLHQAAGYVVIDLRRAEDRRRRREEIASREGPVMIPDASPWLEALPQLDTAIASLSDAQRQVVVLHYLEGRDQRTVAGMLGCSEDAVKKRLAYALGKLRTWFGRHDVALPASALLVGLGSLDSAAAPAHVVEACRMTAKGHAASSAAQAAHGAARLMSQAKVKTLAVAALLAVLTVGGVLAGVPLLRPESSPALVPPPVPSPPATAQPRWQPIGPAAVWHLASLAISPADGRQLFLGTDMGGAFVSGDSGATWTMPAATVLRPSIDCQPAFHPQDPATLYVAPAGARWLLVTHDRGLTWSELGRASLAAAEGLPNGRITIDPTRPSLMFLGLGWGVWRSLDAGLTWTPCRGFEGSLLSLHIDRTSPEAARRCFAGTRLGVWRSTDGGATWQAASGNLAGKHLRCFTGASRTGLGTILYATDSERSVGGIWRSLDGGDSWQESAGRPIAAFGDLQAGDSNPRVVWAADRGTADAQPPRAGVWRSDDAGDTWRSTFQDDPSRPGCNAQIDPIIAITGAFPTPPRRMAVDPARVDRVLVSDGYGHCHLTEDGGGTWRLMTAQAVPGGWRGTGIAMGSAWDYAYDPLDPARQFMACSGILCCVSSDCGATWRTTSRTGRPPWLNSCFQLAIDPTRPGRLWGAFSDIPDLANGKVALNTYDVHRDGGVCRSDDGGSTWVPLRDGAPSAPCSSVVLDPRSPVEQRTLYAGFFGKGVWRSRDNGTTWQATADLGDDPRVLRLALHRDGTLLCLTTGSCSVDGTWRRTGVGIHRSQDQGDHWEPLGGDLGLTWPRDAAMDPADPRIIYICASDRANGGTEGLWRSTDAGVTWQHIFRLPGCVGIAFHPQHADWIYLSACEGDWNTPALWLSRDRGATFVPALGFPYPNALRVAVDPHNGSEMNVTTFGAGVWRGPAEW